MTKVADMAINSKNLYKSYSQNRRTYDFETLPEASVNGALQVIDNQLIFSSRAVFWKLIHSSMTFHKDLLRAEGE